MNSKDKSKPRRVTLTKKQLEEEAGAGLLQICQSIAHDGRLTDDEITDLREWLDINKESAVPGIEFLHDLVRRILKDKTVTAVERKELFRAIERVLPADVRDTVKRARREADATERKRNRHIGHFDFMVAGAKRKEYSELIDGCVDEGDEIFFEREPDNPHDKNAVCVHAGRNYHIGYVPPDDARDVARLLDSGAKYKAYVKKMVGYERPIPVVVAEFYPKGSTQDGLRDETDASKGCGCLGGVVMLVGLAIVIAILLIK